MDLEIIKTVLTVARLRSFSAASYAIPCSQSSVSRRVEAAEGELGVRIFARPGINGARYVDLTPAGEKVVRAMIKIVDSYTELFSVAGADSTVSTTVNIGIRMHMMAPMGISLMKADFYEEYPYICISARHDDFDILLSEFRMRRLDAILFSCVSLRKDELGLESDVAVSFLGTSSFSVGVSAKNQLSLRERISMEDLKDEEFLLTEDPGDLVPGVIFSNRHNLKRACMGMFTPKIKLIPNNMLEIRYKLAIENKGVFPSHTPAPWRFNDGISYVHVDGVDLSTSYYLIYIAGRKEKEIEAFGNFFSKRL